LSIPFNKLPFKKAIFRLTSPMATKRPKQKMEIMMTLPKAKGIRNGRKAKGNPHMLEA
jgi:hypothetical protein